MHLPGSMSQGITLRSLIVLEGITTTTTTTTTTVSSRPTEIHIGLNKHMVASSSTPTATTISPSKFGQLSYVNKGDPNTSKILAIVLPIGITIVVAVSIAFWLWIRKSRGFSDAKLFQNSLEKASQASSPDGFRRREIIQLNSALADQPFPYRYNGLRSPITQKNQARVPLAERIISVPRDLKSHKADIYQSPKSYLNRLSLYKTVKLFTPTKLKRFKLKEDAVTEKSPISLDFPDKAYTKEYNSFDAEKRYSIAPQFVSENARHSVVILDPPKMKPNMKPLPQSPITKKVLSRTPAALKGLENSIAPSGGKRDRIYNVIRPYEKCLPDELTINKGERVYILASHTDGWCLVEKVDKKEESHDRRDSFLNEWSGVVPRVCLGVI